MKLTDEQQLIIQHTGAQVVVAGAGTGKTETLIRHILHLLLEKKYALHEVVAITFTEKAAAEMRERVYKTISHQYDSAVDEEEKQCIQQLRINFPAQNRITTIDGFNASLLASYPEFSPLPVDYQIVDDYSGFILKTETQRAFLKELETNETLTELLEQFLALYEQMEQSLFEKIVFLAAQPSEELEELAKEISREEFEERLYLLLPPHAQQMRKRFLASVPKDFPHEFNQLLHNPANVYQSGGMFTKEGVISKNWLKKNTQFAELAEVWPKNSAKSIKEGKAFLEKYPFIEDSASSTGDVFQEDWECHQALRQIAVFALLYQKKYQDTIRKLGTVKFEDVAGAALEMLEKNPGLREEVRRSIKHILVDEFQDTNRVQWRLIELLRGDDNVMLVGDPKQSIYRFRGADVAVFDEVRTTFEASRQRELTVSQRAVPALVHFYNDLFADVFATANGRESYEAAHQDLHIGRGHEPHSGVTWIQGIENQENDGYEEDKYEEILPDKETAKESLLTALAHFLRLLQTDAESLAAHGGGKTILLPAYEKIAQKLADNEPGVIGVLCATHNVKQKLEKVLRDHDVKFSSYHGRGFYSSLPVLLAINLARFFYRQEDSLALAGMLRSPLGGVSDVTLARLSLLDTTLWNALSQAATDPAHLPEEQEHLARLFEMFLAWRDAARVLPFSDVLEKVWNDSWLSFYFELGNDGGQQEENFSKLIDVLRKAQQASEYGLLEVIEFLQTLRDQESKEADAELPEGGSVQLMTVHASKGLGFDMTILAQLDGASGTYREQVRAGVLGSPPRKYFALKSMDGKDSKKESALWAILKSEDAAREEAEFKRQLYVACTRAKDHLILVIPPEMKNSKAGRWLEPFKHTHALAHYNLSGLQDLMSSVSQTTLTAQEGLTGLPVEIEKPLDGTALPVEISVSQLLDHVFPEAEKEQSPLDESEENAIPFDAKSRGSLIHRLLEWDGKSNLTSLANLMRFYNLALGNTKEIQQLAQSARDHLLQLPLGHDAALHEVPFTLSAKTLQGHFSEVAMSASLKTWINNPQGGQWCNGIIDYLAPVTNGGYAILDFKTHWNPAVQHSAFTRNRIEMQLQIYALAVEQLGFEVKKLYALRIYGDNGQVELEQFDLPGK